MHTLRGAGRLPALQVGETLEFTVSDTLAADALAAAPKFVRRGLWTPLTCPASERHDAAYSIAAAIRMNAHYLTQEERARLAAELLAPHSCDHPHTEHERAPR